MIQQVKGYYLKGVLAIYMIALTSLYVQVQSLFGDQGLVPIRDYVLKNKDTILSSKNPLQTYNVILYAPKLGLTYGTLIELLCIVGVVISFLGLFVRRFINAPSFGLLWYIYYSICSLGQGFMSFHSDLLLLEVGLISVLLAPLLPSKSLTQSNHDGMTFFLVRWLVFRYYVSNIFNLYLEGDDAWYNMTAMPMFANGVQFPSPFSWRLSSIPLDYLKVFQAYTHTTLLCTPFLFLFDLKYCRLMTFYTLLLFSVVSALVFNFGWFDLLVTICLFSFLKDNYFKRSKKGRQSTLWTLFDIALLTAYVGAVGFVLVRCFGLKMNNGVLKAQVMFTKDQVKLVVDHLVPISFVLGILGLLSSAYTSFFRGNKKTSVAKTIVYAVLVGLIFFSSFPTLSRFAPGLENKVKTLTYTKDLSRVVAPLNLSNNYLIFSRVSQNYAEGRPELQIQGRSASDDPTWQQYDLRYKLGHANRLIPRVVPHLPRVELKMWYAARSSLANNKWIQTLAYKLATNEKDVVQSVTELENSYKAKQVRIVLLNYKYSDPKDSPASHWLQPTYQSDYMPTTTVENLKAAVKSNNISLSPSTAKITDWQKQLDIIGDYIRSVQPTAIIWTLAAISAVTMFT